MGGTPPEGKGGGPGEVLIVSPPYRFLVIRGVT